MAQEFAGRGAGELLVLVHEHAVDKDVIDALGDAVGVAVSGGILKPVEVEDNEVGVIALTDKALVLDTPVSYTHLTLPTKA